MEMYKVGGSIRDHFLGLSPNDDDYLIVGSSEKELLSKGYTRIGKDFPVFLHPETKDEYALARVERSTGTGYNDFEVQTEGVTLEQDLGRRDLIINSMAQDLNTKEYIDPYNGRKDIEDKVLRHTSEAFSEDPVRVLRLARLRATLPGVWTIAHETKVLCYQMRDSLTSLTPERMWKEVEKVLTHGTFESYTPLVTFLDTLYELRVLDVLFPEIYEMVHCKEGSKHHREPNVYEHTRMTLSVCSIPPLLQLAVLYHDVGKPHTYISVGSSAGHEDSIDHLVPTWIPAALRQSVIFLVNNHTKVYKTHEMKASSIAKFLTQYRDLVMLELQLSLADLDDIGRIADAGIAKSIQHDEIIAAWKEIKAYSPKQWIVEQETTPSGEAIKQHVHRYNINVVKRVFKRT